jgi:hypothetical protein
MHTHVLNTFNHTGERPQGCQVREHACRQLLKLVAAKVQRAVATQKAEIDQIEPEPIVSARDRHSSRDVFFRFRSCCGIIISHHIMYSSIIPLNSFVRKAYRCYNTALTHKVLTLLLQQKTSRVVGTYCITQHIRHLKDDRLENTAGDNALMLMPDRLK